MRRLRMGDRPLFKALRLRTLAEDPDAFADRHAEALAKPDPYGDDLRRSVTGPSRHVIFVAKVSVRPLEVVFGLRHASDVTAARPGAMGVAPEVRLPSTARLTTSEMVRSL